MTLNIDGCLKIVNNQAGAGGLLRDHSGICVYGFSVLLGTCSIIEVELWALLHGLNIAWNRGVRLLEIEVVTPQIPFFFFFTGNLQQAIQ